MSRALVFAILIAPLAHAANSYVSPQLCAACHPAEAKAYAQTGMGRAFSKPVLTQTTPAAFHHAASDTWYSMEQRGGALYQRRWRIGPSGQPIDMQESRVDYVLGSGSRARSYLHRTEHGALIELPLGWYSENGGEWAMSPGYDREYALPHRAVAYECMFCHNAYPQIPANHDYPGAEPRYSGSLPEGIDCQRCHGPGGEHVTAARAPNPTVEKIRAAIVNPTRLPPARQLEVCMQCHLETTSRPLPHAIVKYNRAPFSYRPGEPLGDFILHYDRAPSNQNADDFEIVSSAYRLRQSQCFLQSAGKLTCTTCHNPHRPQPDAAAYNAVCSTCHRTLAAAHPQVADCVSCHMPKRRTEDVVHAVMTDHLIRRRPLTGDPLAPLAEASDEAAYRGDVVPYNPPAPPSPDAALYNAVAQVTGRANLTRGIPRLAAAIAARKPVHPQFYIELGQAYMSAGKRAAAITAFEEAVQRGARSPNAAIPTAALNLADALTQNNQAARAAALLEHALESWPDEALLWYQLGIARAAGGRDPIGAYQKSVAIDPDLTEAHNLLGAAFASGGDLSRAESELRLALQIDPDYPDALGNLGHLLAARKSLPEAAFYLGRAVTIKPNDAEIRTNYAVTLAGLGRTDEGLRQIDAAIEHDPKSAEAHNFRGVLLEPSGPRAALTEFLEAARLQPDFARAHINAARLLIATGDRAAAIAHLRQAAAGDDANAARQAADLLRQLGVAR